MPSTETKVIFITGASRSGTTLLSFILRNHAQVFGLKELHFFGETWDPCTPAARVSDAKLVEAAATILVRQRYGLMAAQPDSAAREEAGMLVASLAPEDRTFAGVFAATVSRLSHAAGKSIPCEQTPRNIFYAEALLKHFPHAHVVHMIRDPRAVMASQKNRWRRRNLAANKSNVPLAESLRVWVNYHPYTVAKLWLRASQKARQLLGNERFTLVKFEDLLREGEGTVAGLCRRLYIDFEPAMLNVSQINSSHQSSVGGSRPGLNRAAIDSWRESLTSVELAITQELCGSVMQVFGYKTDSVPTPMILGRLWYRLSYILHVAGVLIVNPRRAWIQLLALRSAAT